MFEQFIDRAKELHGDKYDYSKFIYVNAKAPSTIICKVIGHGEFIQKPDHHLRKNAIGCPRCVSINKSKVSKSREHKESKLCVTVEKYLSLLTAKYGDTYKYDFSEFQGITKGSVKLICKNHGESVYSPKSLLISSYGCNKCALEMRSKTKTKTYENFVEEFLFKYKDKYELPFNNKDAFINRRSLIKVICKEHGLFEKSANKLLSGQCCYKCKLEEGITLGKYPGGYGEILFKKNPEISSKIATLYYVCINSKYYKIGITTNSVNDRMKSLKSLSKGFIKNIEIIDELRIDLKTAFNIEQHLLKVNSKYRTYRQWSTELFNQNVLDGISLKEVQCT